MHTLRYLTPAIPARAERSAPSATGIRKGLAALRGLGLGLLLVGATAGALAAGQPVSVTERVALAAAPARTWQTISDFEGWQAWHPAFAGTVITKGHGNDAGTVRVLTAKDGAVFTEELVAYDAAARTYRYRILQSPLPIDGYVSTLEVRGDAGGSSVVWSSIFEIRDGASEADVKKAIAAVYRSGLDNLGALLK
jgi:hypothetical protein